LCQVVLGCVRLC